jgi:hypothetical protein
MKNYIQYLEEVVGLQNIMLNEGHAGDLSDSQNTFEKAQFFTEKGEYKPHQRKYFELIFLNILTQPKESLFLPSTQELFGKMKAAMKLKNLQVLDLDCTVDNRSILPSALSQICESRIVVVFSSFPKEIGELTYKGSGQWIETYSPAYLLEDLSAKKVVWNDLQKVMRELSA